MTIATLSVSLNSTSDSIGPLLCPRMLRVAYGLERNACQIALPSSPERLVESGSPSPSLLGELGYAVTLWQRGGRTRWRRQPRHCEQGFEVTAVAANMAEAEAVTTVVGSTGRRTGALMSSSTTPVSASVRQRPSTKPNGWTCRST